MAQPTSVIPVIPGGGNIEVVRGGGQCGTDICMAGGDAAMNKTVLIGTEEYAIRSPSERVADNRLTPAEEEIIRSYKFDKVIDSTDSKVVLQQKNKILDSIYNNDCLDNTQAGMDGKCEPMRAILNRLIQVMLDPSGTAFDRYIQGRTGTSEPQIVFTISIPFDIRMFESKKVDVSSAVTVSASSEVVAASGEDTPVVDTPVVVAQPEQECEGDNCVDEKVKEQSVAQSGSVSLLNSGKQQMTEVNLADEVSILPGQSASTSGGLHTTRRRRRMY
jgi:hypothetical protein